MKTLKITLLTLILLPCLLTAQTMQRKVLIEEFTNASCPPCAQQNPAFDALLSANSGKVAAVKYHTDWPGVDPMNAHNPGEVDVRVAYYGVTGVPYARMDGVVVTGGSYAGAPANLTQAKIDQAWSVPSPMKITLSYQKSATNDSVYVTMVAKALQTVSGSLVAHIAIEEYEITFASPPGTNGETHFSNVMVKMLPNASGTTLPPTMNAGDSVVISGFWKFANVYEPNLICAAGWVQNNSTKAVLQAAFAPPVGPQTLNAAATSIPYPNVKVCGNQLAPKVTIKNLSGIPLTSVNINYSINGGTVATHAWTGNLLFLETEDVQLPPITFVPVGLGNKIVAYTSMPNGQPDPEPGNDTTTRLFNAAPTSGPTVTLELKTDNYPAQTTWKLFNAAGQTVYQGGPYAAALTTYTEVFNLTSTECYNFVIYDQGGNGICCSYGSGQYKLKNHLSQVFALGGSFGNEEHVPFKVDVSLGIENPSPVNEVRVAPNPFESDTRLLLTLQKPGQVQYIVLNELGQTISESRVMDLGAGEHSLSVNGERWPDGLYLLKIMIGNEVIIRKINLNR